MHRPIDKDRKKTADQDAENNGNEEHIEGMSEAGDDEEEDKPKARWKTLHFWRRSLPIIFTCISFVVGMLLLVIGSHVVRLQPVVQNSKQ